MFQKNQTISELYLHKSQNILPSSFVCMYLCVILPVTLPILIDFIAEFRSPNAISLSAWYTRHCDVSEMILSWTSNSNLISEINNLDVTSDSSQKVFQLIS